MITPIRSAYNAAFTEEKYRAFLKDMTDANQYEIEFRVSETPIFIDKSFRKVLEQAGNDIVDQIIQPDFKQQ